jgi:drug/metabolite transporter (DMT)-like permease
MKQQTKAYLFAIVAVLLWSTIATAFKVGLKHFDYIQLLCYSSFIAFIFLALLNIPKYKSEDFSNITIKDIGNGALRGLLNPFLYYFILLQAYDLLPAQEAMTLNYTWPFMIVILSAPLLKQKINKKGFFAIVLGFVGVVVIATKGNPFALEFSNLKGDLLALSTSIVWALFWILNLRDKRKEEVKLLFSFGFGFLYSLIALLLLSEFVIPDLNGLLSVTYIGLAEMGFTFVIWLKALRMSQRTDQVSQMIYLSPVLSLVWIFLILGEQIHFATIYGLLLIIGGIVIQNRKSTK